MGVQYLVFTMLFVLTGPVFAETRAEVMTECSAYINQSGAVRVGSRLYWRSQARSLTAFRALIELETPARNFMDSLYAPGEITVFDILDDMRPELSFSSIEPLRADTEDFNEVYNAASYEMYRAAIVDALERLYQRLGVSLARNVGIVISTQMLNRTLAYHERAGDSHILDAFHATAEAFHASGYFQFATRCTRRLHRASH